MLEETFTVDPSFDPKRYETEAFGVAWGKPMTVVVRFRADQAPYVREREWHPTQRFRTLPDGRLEMTFRAGGVFEIVRWVLGWGDAAELVRPAALRREIASVLEGAAAAVSAPRDGGLLVEDVSGDGRRDPCDPWASRSHGSWRGGSATSSSGGWCTSRPRPSSSSMTWGPR